MEAVLMAVYTPWLVEMIGSVDVPHEKVNGWIIDYFGFIPVFRGRMERLAMKQALEVLAQKGIIGIFPEGGIWDAGGMQPQTGVAWLSEKSGAPVLPIAFGGTQGALAAAFKFKRPLLTMTIGETISPVAPGDKKDRHTWLEQYARQVMDAVYSLLPSDQRQQIQQIEDEQFELQISLLDTENRPIENPSHLIIQHPVALAKFLHRPGILKIFRSNLHLPIAALQTLAERPSPTQIASATQLVLEVLQTSNPYLLSYRFGPREGEAMQLGLQELLALSQWAAGENLTLHIDPIRRFTLVAENRQVVQIQQGEFKDWM